MAIPKYNELYSLFLFAIQDGAPHSSKDVKEIISLGSHDMFIADVVNVKADDKYLNAETGKFELSEANPLVYVHGGYFELGPKIGKFGWSVEKNRSQTKEKS